MFREDSPVTPLLYGGFGLADATKAASMGTMLKEVDDLKDIASKVKTSDDIFIEELQKLKQKEKVKKGENIKKGKKSEGKEIAKAKAEEINLENKKGSIHLDEGKTKEKDIKSKVLAVYIYSKEEAARLAKGEALNRANEIRSGKYRKPVIYNKKGEQVGG